MINTIKSAFGRWRSGDGATPAVPPALLKNLTPILLLAVGVTALVLMVLWKDQSAYKPVFGAREKVVAADMMTVLDGEQIPYRVHPDSGQVLVPESMLGKVRMLLASKGVTAQLPAGLELMDKNDPLGVSQFVQDVRFRRGLEGELAQSIMTLDAIASARVHLSIAKSTSFVTSDGDKSSASVVIATKPGQKLSPETIAAVVNMVAGSVASLNPARVSLVDQAGNLLSSHVDLADGFDSSAATNENGKRLQDDIRNNIRGLLGPIVGEDNFRLSVTAAVNNNKVEETVEKYGETPKVTSEAMREEQDRNRLVMGVPGTLSNRPPAAEAPKTNPADPNQQPDGSARKNATTRQYAYDRSIVQTKHARGTLEKQSIAVVLAQAAAPFPKTGWTPAELANIDKVLRNGLGINEARGDTLMVTAMNFPAKAPMVPWWQERDTVVDFSSWLSYAVGAILAYFLLLRPLLRLVTARFAPPAPAPVALRGAAARAGSAEANVVGGHAPGDKAAAGAPALGSPEAAQDSAAAQLEERAAKPGMPVVPLLENYDLPPTGSSVDVMVDHLKILAEKEPERVAEVVKQWMQKNGRTQ
ncbi:flagellar MS-ring protein [Massilia sp. Root351]|uniref:flagellar basal-body MS-ring/collar protein FliF n=1 Tax=Massilia sp. Root351 TaxID=1736522 RepID=UPI0007096638|nr:flagellar basal-body MS-ring/collar protein FliF [Massilia sp. Root351]KQV80741.1 flagellar MS-ring protein [Massilia sp. Root351]